MATKKNNNNNDNGTEERQYSTYTKDILKRVSHISIEKELQESYLNYSMSVIVSRALPDVRDGLKPVHRRILYAMYDANLTHDKPYKKSAATVGEVLARYHPHGDAAVYGTMVRMAQDFAMRYLLVDGQGNFGSVDDDPPAAMRYTEARMTRFAEEMLNDIEKDTVKFVPNFDDSRTEPSVLPATLPQLLVNGSMGIAIGMATNMPPHNLREVINAVSYYIDNKNAEIKDLMKFVQGPDFPTAGIIYGKEGIKEAYTTGKGRIKLRARLEIEELKKDREAIIVKELPYNVVKTTLHEKIAELIKQGKIEGISDIRDESSNRAGIRLVIELKRGVATQIVLNQLFKHTDLETTFGIINLALVNGEPKVLNLKELIKYFVEHRVEVITKRTQYDLNQAKAKAHILEGLLIAQANIEKVIKIIRESENTESARNTLMKTFKLSEKQAQAILDMPLKRLTALEKLKIDYSLKEKMIKDIQKINQQLEKDEDTYQRYLDLYNLASGKNNARVSIERYVLATYFENMLVYANVIMKQLSQGRYQLLRKDDAGKGRSQQGLELDVFDQESGNIRSIKTLSGGESFKAALSLALGLSRMVQDYAGGIELNTLFIDEGFGSLDSQSLDQAMNCLMELHHENKLIGIISHVSDLKDRIERQLVVERKQKQSVIQMI